MGALTFNISYKKNSGLIISPEELLELYFFGIDIYDKHGGSISNDIISTTIQAAQDEVEKYLNLKCQKQIIKEDRDFFMDDFKAWGYIRVSYQANKAFELLGFINQVRQIQYPPEWLSVRKSSDDFYYRHIYIVPQHTLQGTVNSVIYSGVTPHLGFLGQTTIPNYWSITYCTGFEKVPFDLLNFIGKLAAINIFRIAGDLILGPGISSQSLGIDGLSQSVGTTKSGTTSAYGGRIQGYLEDLQKTLPRLYNTYKGFTVTSL